MKFTLATCLLVSTGSAKYQRMFAKKEDGLTENLRVEMNRWAMRRLDRYYGERIEDVDDDFRDELRDLYEDRYREEHGMNNDMNDPKMTDPMAKDEYYYERNYVSTHDLKKMAAEEYANSVTKDLFGWTIRDKIKQINPEKRYGPTVQKIMQSKEFADYVNFMKEASRNPEVRHVMKEAKWAYMDIAGGCDDGNCQRGFYAEDYRKRPNEEETKAMGIDNDQEQELEIEGLYLDNDDIKNAAEDIEHVYNDFRNLMDVKNPLTAKSLELDAKLRFSPAVQEMIKMVFEDFGIKSEEDIMRAGEAIAQRVGKDMENCPYFRRMRKAVERMLRYAMKNVNVSDLPEGKRMAWVNDLSKRLYDIIDSGDSVQDLHEFAEDIVEGTFNEIGQWMMQAEAYEQTFNPANKKEEFLV